MNTIERTLIRHQAGIDDLPHDQPWKQDFERDDAACERVVLEEALRAAGGNISRAARRIGVARSTLRYRIERNGLGHLVPKD